MNDKIEFFNSDNKCYESKYESDELNNYLDNNFFIEKMQIYNNNDNTTFVDECSKKALDNNKDFFLISNFEQKNKDSFYTCYIPKVSKLCNISNISDLFKPFNKIISDLFKTEKSILFNNLFDVKQTVNFNDLIKTTKFNNCFNITNDKKISPFAKYGNFILYKTELINNPEYINSIENIKPYLEYKNKYDIFSYENELDLLKLSFKEYICNPNINNEKKFDGDLIKLKNKYSILFSEVDSISLDISNLSVITKYETLYLKKIQEDIDKLKRELNSLIGFDGGNNGKLKDTRFIKNITISQNILLIFIIIISIFLYRKNKI
tara:strand:+ start:2498 stop:3460 length:963 start_codon:yes stop_codon:yes gene_type:complete